MAYPCPPSMTAVKFILGIILVVALVLIQPPKCQGQPEPGHSSGFEMVSNLCGLKEKEHSGHYHDLVRVVRKELVQHTHQRSYTYNYELENKCFGYACCDQCIDCLHGVDIDMERGCHFFIEADITFKACSMKIPNKESNLPF